MSWPHAGSPAGCRMPLPIAWHPQLTLLQHVLLAIGALVLYMGL